MGQDASGFSWKLQDQLTEKGHAPALWKVLLPPEVSPPLPKSLQLRNLFWLTSFADTQTDIPRRAERMQHSRHRTLGHQVALCTARTDRQPGRRLFPNCLC